MNRLTDRQIEKYLVGETERWMDEQTDKQKDTQLDRHTEMNRLTDGQMVRWLV